MKELPSRLPTRPTPQARPRPNKAKPLNGVPARTKALAQADFRHLHQPQEMRALDELMRGFAIRLRKLTLRRETTGGSRRIDIPGTARRSVSHGGEPMELIFRQRRQTPPRLVLLLDVSRSMNLYSFFFLRLARALQGVRLDTRVFIWHTRLSGVSEALRDPDPWRAQERLQLLSAGWAGGTRIGECLEQFEREHSALVHSRTALIVVSDGYDTGEPALLAGVVRRLRRRARRLVWLNPLAASDDYQPLGPRNAGGPTGARSFCTRQQSLEHRARPAATRARPAVTESAMKSADLLELSRELTRQCQPHAWITVISVTSPSSAYVGAQAIVRSDGDLSVGSGAAAACRVRHEPRPYARSPRRFHKDCVSATPRIRASRSMFDRWPAPAMERSSCLSIPSRSRPDCGFTARRPLSESPPGWRARRISIRSRMRKPPTWRRCPAPQHPQPPLRLEQQPRPGQPPGPSPDPRPKSADAALERETYALIATQGEGDEVALEAALRSCARAVLVIASRRKADRLRTAMSLRGISNDRIDAMHAPAGPDIGAVTPNEIALAAVAGLVALRRGRLDVCSATAVPGGTTFRGAPDMSTQYAVP